MIAKLEKTLHNKTETKHWGPIYNGNRNKQLINKTQALL